MRLKLPVRRPSPATVMALAALFIALGGTALAAKHYVISNTSQIKPSVLRALRASNLGHLFLVHGPIVTIPPSGDDFSIAQCPAGYDVVSGGYSSTLPIGAFVFQNEPVGEHEWWAEVINRGSEVAHVTGAALCAPAGLAVAAKR